MDNSDNEDLSLLASNLALENAQLKQQILDYESIINGLEKHLNEANNKLDSISLDIAKVHQHLQYSLSYAEDINKHF